MEKIQVGKAVELEVDRETEFGYFLTDGTDDVLLHNSEIAEGAELEIGQEVTVFIYLDKQGRLTSTMKIPDIQIGTYGWAEVVNVRRELGVFVHIGLSKDILVSLDDLPNLQHLWPNVGDRLYVSLKTDRQERLFAKLATEDVIQEYCSGSSFKRCQKHDGERKRIPFVDGWFIFCFRIRAIAVLFTKANVSKSRD